jgi:hypothetical protein
MAQQDCVDERIGLPQAFHYSCDVVGVFHDAVM